MTPLQVRYIAKANAGQADSGFWRRMVRWNYYNRDQQAGRSLLWLIETRVHEHFDHTVNQLENAESLAGRYSYLGEVVNHLQDMSTPASAVPVFTGRWWRFSMSDRFDNFPVDEDGLLEALGTDCSSIEHAFGPEDSVEFKDLLRQTADGTVDAVQTRIAGMPVSWEVFWKLDSNPSRVRRVW